MYIYIYIISISMKKIVWLCLCINAFAHIQDTTGLKLCRQTTRDKS